MKKWKTENLCSRIFHSFILFCHPSLGLCYGGFKSNILTLPKANTFIHSFIHSFIFDENFFSWRRWRDSGYDCTCTKIKFSRKPTYFDNLNVFEIFWAAQHNIACPTLVLFVVICFFTDFARQKEPLLMLVTPYSGLMSQIACMKNINYHNKNGCRHHKPSTSVILQSINVRTRRTADRLDRIGDNYAYLEVKAPNAYHGCS